MITKLLAAGLIDTSSLPHPTTSNTLQTVLAFVFGLTASIAVLMIVIGGFRYITSHGDPNGMTQARNTIIYSIVGLVVVMAAYSIVIFVVKGLS